MEQYSPEEAIIEAQKFVQKIASNEATDYPDAEKKVAEDEAELAEAFHLELDKVLENPLSPENIDTYAEDAVDGIVKLIDKVLAKYASKAPEGLTKQQFEDLAFKHFELYGINETLDYITSKEHEIKHLDEIIGKAFMHGSVLVPPQSQKAEIIPGEGTFREKLTIPRTKTLLFVLANDFNVNVEDSEQLKLTSGVVTDTMMRKLSYTMIEVPKLERVILCCDEEKNVTYIFDTKATQEIGVSANNLSSLSKQELDSLIEDNPTAGRRIKYTSRFVAKMITRLRDINISDEMMDIESKEDHFLIPSASDGMLTVGGLIEKIKVENGCHTSHQSIYAVLEDMGVRLEDIPERRFQTGIYRGLDEDLQQKIIQRMSENGSFAERASHDELPAKAIANTFGTTFGTIDGIMDKLEKEGIKFSPKFSGSYKKPVRVASPDQIKIIEARLGNTELAPEGYLSPSGIARKEHRNKKFVFEAINALGDLLGEPMERRIGGRIGQRVFSPELQDKIVEYVDKKHPRKKTKWNTDNKIE